MTRYLAMAAALAACGQPGAAGDPAPDQRIATILGYVGETGDEGDHWFALDYGEQRFRLPPVRGAEMDRYTDLIDAATERGFALRVRYDATAGEAGADGPYVIYPVCSLAVGDAEPLGDERTNCPPGSGSAEGAEAQLALGVGLWQEGPEQARRLLGEALSAGRLPTHLRALGFNIRGGAAERLAGRHPPASAEHDRLTAEALSDYRNWVGVAPGDAEAVFAVARMLANLGGYDESAAVLEALGRTMPDRAFDVAIRTGALYRQRGDYPRALRQLDDFAARHGPQDGMRYLYHRAWTLMTLGRDREALADLDRGMGSQPDYSSAWLLRSCLHARLGSLADALADQERALALIMLLPAREDPALAADIARSRALIEALRAAVASGRNRPMPAACEGFWDDWQRPRPRSALLDRPAS